MARTASSAEPDRLAAYGTAAGGVDEALARDLARLEPDAAAFFTGAGELAPAGTADQWTSPLASLRAEVAHLGRWVAGVGAGFLVAGADGDGDGTYEATDDALAPRVGRAVRSEHRVFLAEQLSTLYERARTGELDPTSGQLAHILAMARLLVDDAADPQSEAERLVAAMGVGDLITAVALLSSGAADATSVDHPAVAGMLDLGHILSLGLESDPVRADRWADEILGHAVFGSLPGPLAGGLAVTGAGNAPGTSVYGVEVFGTLVAGAGPTPALGLVHRLYGTTDPVAPIMATAASRSPDGSHPQAPLAHAITRDALDDPSAMVRVFGGEGPPAHDEVRRDVLVAAVDPSLPDDQRVRLANDLAGHYVAARESPVVTTFDLRLHSPTVTEGFGAAMQPLLDHWQGDRAHRIAVDAGDGGASIVDDTLLWDAVGHLGQDPGGANGLSTALAGTTTARLTASYATAAERTLAGMPTDIPPFGRYDLQQLGHVYAQVATTVGNARFSAVVDAVESDGDRLGAAVASLARGVVGEVPGGSTLAGATEALAILTRDDPDVTGGGSTMSGLAVHLTRDLVAFNLQARPDLATPGLNAALLDAKAADGDMGVHLLIHDDRAPLDTSGGRELADLQQLVHDQEATINLDLALAIDDTMRTEGG